MKRKKESKAKSPLIRLVGLEVAVAATGIAGSLTAAAAPGDLDPTFGDVGRSNIEVPTQGSNLWSVDVQGDDSVLFGGGEEYDYYYSWESSLVGALLPNGAPDASFAAAALTNTAIYDTTRQSDGKVIGVGTARQPDGSRKLLVFRLRPDGALDPDFGLGGTVVIRDGGTAREAGYSVVVDPDGGIVIAGERAGKLLVVRLLANGTLDAAFGSGGVYVGRAVSGTSVRIAGAAAGGYRIAANFSGGTGWECGVVGLTAAGGLDAAFGSGGYATPQAPGGGLLHCSSLAMQPDGRILLGGQDDDASGYVGRLLANGVIDPSFAVGVVPGRFATVSALAVGATGSIFAAGHDRTGFSGALVVRLLADGTLDTLFGQAGATNVDLKTRRATVPTINDMQIVAGEGLVVGGSANSPWPGGAFVARLLGNAAGGSPGVLGMKQSRILGTEQAGQVVLSVQRTGGSSGPIAVTYFARDFPPAAGPPFAPGAPASGGSDYTTTTGRLTWADGDFSDREIVVPIASDANTEVPEFFEVVLESPEGGAGLGAYGADVEIAGASYPIGDLTIAAIRSAVSEGQPAEFYVYRNHYGQGAVSVTVRVAAGGDATSGQDFSNSGKDWQDVVLTWADGEIGGKYLPVQIVADGAAEQAEMFTLELVSPTGGAVLGDATQATVQINASASQPPPPASGGGGGGGFGWLGAMLLGLGGALRRRRIWNR